MTGSLVGYGLTGVTQTTTGVISAADVTFNTMGSALLNQITATGDVRVIASAAITQNSTSVVSAAGNAIFHAGDTILLSRVDGSSVSITSATGAIVDNNDGIAPNTLNISSTGTLTLIAGTNIGTLANPIEIQVSGQTSVGTGGLNGPAQIALTGSTGGGFINALFGPVGTLIFFNGKLQVAGGTPDKALNSLRNTNDYAVWSQYVIDDEDTTEHQLLIRSKASPKRPRAQLR
jgi:hypothetical protein